MRQLPRAILAGGLGFAAAVSIAACGSTSGLLSSDQANTLDSSLSAVASAINKHHCSEAGDAAQDFSSQVNQVSASLKPSLADNLKQAGQALADNAQTGCENSGTKSIPTTTHTTSTPTQTATSPVTTSTPTETTTSTPPATTVTTPTSATTTGTGSTTPSGGAGLGTTPTTSTTGNGDGGAPTGNGDGNTQ